MSIIRNILAKIQFHFFFYVMLFLCIITGYFKECLVFMSFIIAHEMGHIFAALFYQWNIEKILILPFGGMTVFCEKINRPLKEEGVIAIMGIVFQSLFYILLCMFIKEPWIARIHYAILCFNLLPIYPLDGAKMVSVLFHFIFSFKKTHILVLVLTFIALSIGTFYVSSNLLLILCICFLWIGFIKESKKHPYLYHKFLLERYLEPTKYKKIKRIEGKNLKKMKRDRIHFFMEQKKVYTEREVLQRWFDKRR